MPDKDQGGGINIEGGGDSTIGGDVVGGDKITTTTTHTANVGEDSVAGDKITQTAITTNVEGGPTTRLAIAGVIGVAVLAILVLAAIVFDGGAPARPSPTPSATATVPPTATLPASTSTFVIAVVTDTPIPATTEPPSPTPTITPTPSLTPTTETPTPTDTAFPTNTPTLTPTPSPTSALGVYDDFNDQCLDEARWALQAEPVGFDTPTPTPIPVQGNCLDSAWEFLTENREGHLAVFLTLEGDVTNKSVQKSSAGYQEVEVTLALHDVIVFDDNMRSAYLSVGVWLSRVSGDGFLEVRLEGTNPTGKASPPTTYQITSRLAVPDGYQNFGPWPYTLDQLITVAFRVADNRLTIYLDHQPLSPSFSILPGSLPRGLTLGYHADTLTLLEGYFDEVRLAPLP